MRVRGISAAKYRQVTKAHVTAEWYFAAEIPTPRPRRFTSFWKQPDGSGAREIRSRRRFSCVTIKRMVDHTVRALDPDEHRDAVALFASTLHQSPPTDERWAQVAASIEPGWMLGAFDDELIGTARGIDTRLVTRGGDEVANAAVTTVGVRSDRTRRGVLTDLMHSQLADFAERGLTTANLHASEAAIYGRFGYGPATYARNCSVDRHRAVLRDDLPVAGEVDRLGAEEAKQRLPEVYASLPADRSGLLSRPTATWDQNWAYRARWEPMIVTVVHHGAMGLDGFAVYDVQRSESKTELTVRDMHAGTVAGFTGLWRYLLGVDLVDEITLPGRPLDDPAALLFTDPRSYRQHGSVDETWLRLVDVRGALQAMRRDGDPLVIEVSDRMLESNSGRYLITPETVDRTDEPADLRMNVGELAMAYLGAWRPSALAAFGRIAYAGADVLTTADRMFASRRAPWCGTAF